MVSIRLSTESGASPRARPPAQKPRVSDSRLRWNKHGTRDPKRRGESDRGRGSALRRSAGKPAASILSPKTLRVRCADKMTVDPRTGARVGTWGPHTSDVRASARPFGARSGLRAPRPPGIPSPGDKQSRRPKWAEGSRGLVQDAESVSRGARCWRDSRQDEGLEPPLSKAGKPVAHRTYFRNCLPLKNKHCKNKLKLKKTYTLYVPEGPVQRN